MRKLLRMMWKWLEWQLNDISPLWLSFLVILKWRKNDGMRRNEAVFKRAEKTEFWNTCHSAIIQSFLCHSNQYIFSHLKWAWNDSQMTSNYFNRVLSPLRRQHPIKVFWSSSCIAWAGDEFEVDLNWNDIWMRNDTEMTEMIMWWIGYWH